MPAREYTPQRQRDHADRHGARSSLATVRAGGGRDALGQQRASRVELSPQAIERENVCVRLPLHWKPQRAADERSCA